MKNLNANTILSWLCITGGAFLFIIFSGDLILKILGGIFALWLISYGLNMQGTSFQKIGAQIKAKIFKNN